MGLPEYGISDSSGYCWSSHNADVVVWAINDKGKTNEFLRKLPYPKEDTKHFLDVVTYKVSLISEICSQHCTNHCFLKVVKGHSWWYVFSERIEENECLVFFYEFP